MFVIFIIFDVCFLLSTIDLPHAGHWETAMSFIRSSWQREEVRGEGVDVSLIERTYPVSSIQCQHRILPKQPPLVHQLSPSEYSCCYLVVIHKHLWFIHNNTANLAYQYLIIYHCMFYS